MTTQGSADIEALAACPACGDDRFRPLPTPGRWIGPEVFEPLRGRIGLVECRRCRLAFINPRPSPSHLSAFYAGSTYDCHETAGSSSAGAVADHLLERIQPHLPEQAPRTVLDYGAGGGGFLLRMREHGWQAHGLEPGRRGLDACRSAGLAVVADPAQLPSAYFGLVTFHHVFEHLRDPEAVLATVRRVLAPEGRLFIEVPNIRSLRARMALPALSARTRVDERYRAFPIHLAYYDRRTLVRVLEQAGWQVETSFTLGMGVDEWLIRPPAARGEPAGHAPQAAADGHRRGRTAGRSSGRRRLRHHVRDAFLGLGLGENLAVIARPAATSG
jgi:SAM-dependent methyltransferase